MLSTQSQGAQAHRASHRDREGSPEGALERQALIQQLKETLRSTEACLAEDASRRVVATGLVGVDALLPGGFQEGAVAGVAGSWSSGKTTLALMAVVSATRRGERAAIVDGSGGLFPPALSRLGADLRRLLVVRATGKLALWASEQIARSQAFRVVVLLASMGEGPASSARGARLDLGGMRRLQLAAEQASSVVLLVCPELPTVGMLRTRIRSHLVDPGRPSERPQNRFMAPPLHALLKAELRSGPCAVEALLTPAQLPVSEVRR